MLFTWERSFDPEMALPRSSSGKSNYLGYIYTHWPDSSYAGN